MAISRLELFCCDLRLCIRPVEGYPQKHHCSETVQHLCLFVGRVESVAVAVVRVKPAGRPVVVPLAAQDVLASAEGSGDGSVSQQAAESAPSPLDCLAGLGFLQTCFVELAAEWTSVAGLWALHLLLVWRGNLLQHLAGSGRGNADQD